MKPPDCSSDSAARVQALETQLAECRQREQALLTTNKRFRALVEHAWEGLALIDAGGILRYISPAVARTEGYEPEERLGHAVFERLHPDDLLEAQQRFGQLLQTPGITLMMQCRQQHKNGS